MNNINAKSHDELFDIKMTNNIKKDISEIIELSQRLAYKSVNIMLLMRNWLIGKRIYDEELKDLKREELYGMNIIKELSVELSIKYGRGFNKTNLYNFYSFYQFYPNIFHTVSGKSNDSFLSWSHYRILIQEKNDKARKWYEEEAKREMWGTRTLQRNISSQYYFRMLNVNERKKLKNKEYYSYENNKLEFIKNPLIAEFLGFKVSESYTE